MNRLATGLTAALIWGGILYIQSFRLLWFVVFIVGVIALYEYFKICLPQYSLITRTSTVFLSSLPIISICQASTNYLLPSLLTALLAFILLAIFLPSVAASQKENFILKTSTGLLLVGLCASHLPLLVTLEDGFLWLGLLTTITIASDTGAYYTGTNFGTHKLCPAISPGKTFEGLCGGLVCSVFFAWIYKALFLQNQATVKIVVLTIIICLIGVCGDLTESIIKRANNTKDSGSILPGHGGVLDRIDSILASAPALFYFISLGFMY
jgi:phosphatidate cytidylyltransferase